MARGVPLVLFLRSAAVLVLCSDDSLLSEIDMPSDDDLNVVYAEIDKNHDGKATMDELAAYTKTVHVEQKTRETPYLLEDLDSNGDKYVDITEAIEASGQDPALAREVFNAADADEDGYLNEAELADYVVPELHNSKVNEVLARHDMEVWDANRDGRVTPKEFEFFEENNTRDMRFTNGTSVDMDHNGTLSLGEIESWEAGDFDNQFVAASFFDSVHKDHDNGISAEEFRQASKDLLESDIAGELVGFLQRHHNTDL